MERERTIQQKNILYEKTPFSVCSLTGSFTTLGLCGAFTQTKMPGYASMRETVAMMSPIENRYATNIPHQID
jgi:hypothetical protein